MAQGIEQVRNAALNASRKRRFFKMAKETGIDHDELEGFMSESSPGTLPPKELQALVAFLFEGRMILDLQTDTLMRDPALNQPQQLGMAMPAELSVKGPICLKIGNTPHVHPLAPEPKEDAKKRAERYRDSLPKAVDLDVDASWAT